jgi:hypothetical protein
LLRGEKVILDSHLAELYGVTTKALNQAVQRNTDRFPDDFMFQLSDEEAESLLKSQIVTSKPGNEAIANDHKDLLRSQSVTSKRPPHTGGRRYRPYAFTEQGVAMLSGLLNSPRAVAVNVEIMRAFVRMRQLLSTHVDLARKLTSLEKKYDAQFKAVFDAIRELMEPPTRSEREMGFHTLFKKSRKAKIKA